MELCLFTPVEDLAYYMMEKTTLKLPPDNGCTVMPGKVEGNLLVSFFIPASCISSKMHHQNPLSLSFASQPWIPPHITPHSVSLSLLSQPMPHAPRHFVPPQAPRNPCAAPCLGHPPHTCSPGHLPCLLRSLPGNPLRSEISKKWGSETLPCPPNPGVRLEMLFRWVC